MTMTTRDAPWYAALHHHSTAEELTSAGIELQPLARAARDGDLSKLLTVLEAASPDEPGAEDCYTPLHWACCYGRLNCVEALLRAGANPNARTDIGMSPSALAAGKGFPDALAAVIDAGGDPHAPDQRGWTPLHRAAWNCHELCVVALLARGADPGRITKQGWQPLHQAARFGSGPCVSALLKGGADVGARCEGVGFAGWSALHLAAHNGQVTAVAALLAGGADPEAVTSAGLTASDCAARFESEQHAECLEMLLREEEEEARGKHLLNE